MNAKRGKERGVTVTRGLEGKHFRACTREQRTNQPEKQAEQRKRMKKSWELESTRVRQRHGRVHPLCRSLCPSANNTALRADGQRRQVQTNESTSALKNSRSF